MTTTTPATTPDARAMPTIEALYAAGDSVKSGDAAAFDVILRGADGGSDVSVRQLAATLLKAHAAVRLEAASAALIALCEDAELRVRLTAIGALPSLCTAAGGDGAQLRRTTAAVLGAALRLSAAQTKEGRLALTVTTTLARERPAAALHAALELVVGGGAPAGALSAPLAAPAARRRRRHRRGAGALGDAAAAEAAARAEHSPQRRAHAVRPTADPLRAGARRAGGVRRRMARRPRARRRHAGGEGVWRRAYEHRRRARAERGGA